jgi:hypothetical protein
VEAGSTRVVRMAPPPAHPHLLSGGLPSTVYSAR